MYFYIRLFIILLLIIKSKNFPYNFHFASNKSFPWFSSSIPYIVKINGVQKIQRRTITINMKNYMETLGKSI